MVQFTLTISLQLAATLKGNGRLEIKSELDFVVFLDDSRKPVQFSVLLLVSNGRQDS
jgi:hypothetical protein